MKKEGNAARTLFLDFIYDFGGSLLYAAGTLLFVAPSNIAPGGASGVAIMLGYLFGLPIGTTAFVINIPLLFLALRFLGRAFTLKTLRTLAINTVVMDVLIAPVVARYYDAATLLGADGQLLGSLFGGVLVGAGLGTIFLRDSTTGGTDIVGRLLQLKFPYLPIGRAMMVVDACVLLSSIVVFRSLRSGLYGMITIFVTSKVIDGIVYGADKGTMALIVTTEGRAIADGILSSLDRGATLLKGTGAYSKAQKDVIVCAVRTAQFHRMKTIVYRCDPGAFIIVTEAGEVYGEGFKEMERKR
ncbi:MAG: YitT family protein [Provencibacterium sp.]|nr:YitT family protein [Provencibacterium sp.]